MRRGAWFLRRLNRVEYENTVRDLLGVDANLKDSLPLDSSADGFDNIGDALHISSFSMDRYLEAADAALNQAIAKRPKPPASQKRIRLTETHQVRTTGEKVFRIRDDGGVVMFSSAAWLMTMLLLGTSQVPPIAGVTQGHHDLSHHGQDPTKIA